MIDQIIKSAIEIVFAIGVIIVLFETFVSDFLSARIDAFKKNRNRKHGADKIAQIKLISNNPKEIEKFIVDNAEFLSEESVKALVLRMEVLQADKALFEDSFKQRLDLSQSAAAQIQDEDEQKSIKRRR